ncbi:hypothetical protein SAMN04487850_0386 [Prevotella aff. ruminicola Tc2-24]|uniref:DUF6371 domain-containing protein n=2 Tax=Prevotellaceae TaxID=171552 RepID=A0A1I0M9R3_9BACT|nr:hypothetical protein SAMN04487828_0381 [Prevotella sp. lc2012]SEV84091.1 hypothetical protein SAMN04487850_0386 [Prevotella aff. ruminicola Tc2-24]
MNQYNQPYSQTDRLAEAPLYLSPLMGASIKGDTSSLFCQAAVANGYLTDDQMLHAAIRYQLTTSDDGGVIFWQADRQGKVRDGKIMFYRDDCHRDHDHTPDWIVSRMRRQHLSIPADHKSEHCLFGLHLLSPDFYPQVGNAPKTVAIVEAEKTAVICSELFPDYLWMASGGLTELNVSKLMPLEDLQLILFPDTDPEGTAYRRWHEVAEAASDVFGHPVTISSLLEQRATPAQKAAKIDLIEFLDLGHPADPPSDLLTFI